MKFDWLHHVGVGAQGVTLSEIALLSGRRQHDDGNRFQVRIALDRPQHFDAIDLRHLQIEKHDDGIALLSGP